MAQRGDWTTERLMALPVVPDGELGVMEEGFPVAWEGPDGRLWSVERAVRNGPTYRRDVTAVWG